MRGRWDAGRQIVMVRANRTVARTVVADAAAAGDAFGVNLRALAGAFAQCLRQDGSIAVSTAQAERYTRCLELDMPRSRRSLYCLTREVFVTDAGQLSSFDRVFAALAGAFGFQQPRGSRPRLAYRPEDAGRAQRAVDATRMTGRGSPASTGRLVDLARAWRRRDPPQNAPLDA